MLESRLLDNLDEDLLHELVEVCRGNQIDYQPVSRGRNQEEYVLEKYPEIVSLLEQDRQKRIDAISMRSRREVYGENFRVGSSDSPASPLARKTKVVPSGSFKPETVSPILRAKQSTGDLIFHMDDEHALSSEPAIKPGAAKSTQERAHHAETLSPRLQPTIQGSSFNSQSDLDSEETHALLNQGQAEFGPQALTPKEENLLPEKSATSVPPWAAVTVPSSKTGLKDIMAESSVGKSPLGTSAGQEGSHAKNFSPKLSQKERKRLQQQQHFETNISQPSFKASPWQTAGKAEPKSSIKSILSSESSQQESKSSIPDRTASKPSMTLRQTVAGTPPPQSKPLNPPKSQNRSVSSPILMPSPHQPNQRQPTPNPTPSSLTESPETPRSIQTVRHTSKHPNPIIPNSSSSNNNNNNHNSPPTADTHPSSSLSQLSLASILFQQQSEKDEIREAATAKHNLQEIQLEQEFQQWWDEESKRVMEQAEADAAAVAASTSTGRGGHSGRGGRGKGKGRGNHHNQNRGRGNLNSSPGGANTAVREASHQQTHDDAVARAERGNTEESAGHRDGHGGGGGHRRGHHRGRGGGHRGGRGGKEKEKARQQPVS